ncbi:MAG TPA: O-methyltransferase [Bacteroidia bacterium]|jgi:predicted O-methyltransferase YrrM|nr:O-methyltransferase [Bacteroidia bacterium]
MDFLEPDLDSYVCDHTKPENVLLQQLNRETYAKVLMPRMLSGHLQGRVLSMLSHMIKPGRILEVGTFTGYSALCLAEGLAEEGLLHTIDLNEELETMVRSYFSKSDFNNRIQYHIGDASLIIPTLQEVWDLVFIDADKENYSNYYDLVFDRVRKGGYIIADNVLWSGKVVQENLDGDEDTKSIVAFNTKVMNDNRVENVLFPIRDGLMIVRKK